MRRHWQLIAIPLLLMISGCGEKEPDAPITETTDPFSESTPLPAPSPETQIVEATPPPSRFLPEGEFVLIKRLSVVTGSGIVGADPGTRVQLVKTAGTVLTVTDGHAEFDATAEHLTNNLDEIEALDELIAARSTPASPTAATSQPVSFHQPQQSMPPAPAAPATDPSARRAEDRARISEQIAQMDQSIRSMRNKLRALNDQQFKGLTSVHGSYKAARLAHDRNTPEESRINALLEKAEAQRNALERQRESLR